MTFLPSNKIINDLFTNILINEAQPEIEPLNIGGIAIIPYIIFNSQQQQEQIIAQQEQIMKQQAQITAQQAIINTLKGDLLTLHTSMLAIIDQINNPLIGNII